MSFYLFGQIAPIAIAGRQGNPGPVLARGIHKVLSPVDWLEGVARIAMVDNGGRQCCRAALRNAVRRDDYLLGVRAIGGQRRFVMLMFLIETGLLGMVAGFIGTALGTALILQLGQSGIPAMSDVVTFLFSGPRLYPDVGLSNILGAFGIIVMVILAATFYPARLATRIEPVVAMQARE